MDRPVGFAVIGVGLVGPTHARFANQAEGATLRVVCDLREDRGRPLAMEHDAAWYSDYREVMQRDDIDIVTICLPTALHLEVATAAAEAGKHVLVEKPIELNIERAQALVDVCKRNGVKLGAIFNRRFVHGTNRTHEAVHSGQLGKMLVADMRFKAWRAPEYYSESGWRGTWDKEGGAALINQGIHGVDLMTWIAGPIKRVQGYARHLRHTIEGDDTTIAVVEYASGALGIIQCTTSVKPKQPDRLEFHGENGSILLEEYKIVGWQLDDGSAPGEPSAEELARPAAGQGTTSGHFFQVQDMANAVREGRDPVIRGEDVLHSLAVVRAIYEAERTGAAVDVPQPPELARR